MKKLIVCLLALTLVSPSVLAVLPEENVDQTVRKLQKELEMMKSDIELQKSQYEASRKNFWDETTRLEGDFDMAALVLHSQSENWIFRMAQASQFAHDATAKFNNRQRYIENFFADVNSTIEKVHATRKHLGEINQKNLSPAGIKSMKASVRICEELEGYYNEYMKRIEPDRARYKAIANRVKELDEQNHQTLSNLYNYIFVKGNEPFGSVLWNFPQRYETLNHDMNMYVSDGHSHETSTESTSSGGSVLANWTILILTIGTYIVFRFQKKKASLKQYASFWAMILFFSLNILSDTYTLFFNDSLSYDHNDQYWTYSSPFASSLCWLSILSMVTRRACATS